MKNDELIRKFLMKQSGIGNNLFSNGNKLVSYTTCIAQYDDRGVLHINTTEYTHSSNEHLQMLLNECSGMYYVEEKGVKAWTSDICNRKRDVYIVVVESMKDYHKNINIDLATTLKEAKQQLLSYFANEHSNGAEITYHAIYSKEIKLN